MIYEIEIENNLVWLGTHDGDLARLDGQNWEIYNSSNSVVPSFVLSIAIDSKGNKWVATADGLVFTTR